MKGYVDIPASIKTISLQQFKASKPKSKFAIAISTINKRHFLGEIVDSEIEFIGWIIGDKDHLDENPHITILNLGIIELYFLHNAQLELYKLLNFYQNRSIKPKHIRHEIDNIIDEEIKRKSAFKLRIIDEEYSSLPF